MSRRDGPFIVVIVAFFVIFGMYVNGEVQAGNVEAELCKERDAAISEVASATVAIRVKDNEVAVLRSADESWAVYAQSLETSITVRDRRITALETTLGISAGATITPLTSKGDTRVNGTRPDTRANAIPDVTYPNPADVPEADVWTREQAEQVLRNACSHYNLTSSQTQWIVAKGLHIAWGESRYNTKASNRGVYLGLFQFSGAWASADERLDGEWSCYRFVRVYRDGGEAKIRQHWAATY